MERTSSTAFLILLASCGGVQAGPVLLASYNEVFGGRMAPQSIARVQFILQISEDVPLSLDESTGVGFGVWWEEGGEGTVDFALDNAEGFAAFAFSATDGVDTRFASVTGFWQGNTHGIIGPESTLFGIAPDLLGYQLELVRLIVNGILFDSISIEGHEGFSVESDITYEFYGSAVPEPATLILLSIGWLSLVRRRGLRA